jgi:predicted Zn-dependent peptidase
LYQKTILENGLRLVTDHMPHTRSVAINFFVGTGSRYETDKEAGISHFVEHMCFKGTEKYPTSTDVSSVIEGVGGILNAGTDKELTVYWCKVAEPHFERALDVLADILLHSKYDQEELERERQVIIEEINMSLDSPSQRVSMLIDELMWPGQPLGRDIAGGKETVASITRQMMLDYMAAQYRPQNIVLSIAGAVEPSRVGEAVAKATAGWPKVMPPLKYAPYQPNNGRRVLIEKRETEQTQLCLSMPGIAIDHADRFRLDLLNVILGEGMSSRLFTEVRDKMGLAYSIQSYAEHFLDTGAMTISAGVDTKNLGVAVKAVIHELTRIKTDLQESEVHRAKELFKGRIWLRMEDSRAVAGWMGTQEILTGRLMSTDEVIQRIESITLGDLKDIAASIFDIDGLRLAAVGPIDPDKNWEELLKS